jgi:hypothetical protein
MNVAATQSSVIKKLSSKMFEPHSVLSLTEMTAPQWPTTRFWRSRQGKWFLGEAEIDCKVTFNQGAENLRVLWIHKLAYVLGGEFPNSESWWAKCGCSLFVNGAPFSPDHKARHAFRGNETLPHARFCSIMIQRESLNSQ